ncbi:hypothetical protein DFJ74DRAFT_712151 [Hyaloraphidium curvatum]|nr:hypothetical protein DFJ74DRAFT_712151 [Hyaloraphidium curvatum]
MSSDSKADYGKDIFNEPAGSPFTLEHLGPLAALAGTWRGLKGRDAHPVAEGAEKNAYVETFDLQPIDRQTNGPQLFYGLRYHQHITKPGELETFHDQVGYLLWEPAARRVIYTMTIPRGQAAMAVGPADADSKTWTCKASQADPHAGILSNDFLDKAFKTTAWEMTFEVGPGDSWGYTQTTTLVMEGRGEFPHTDASRLTRIAPPRLNPLAEAAKEADKGAEKE